MTARTILVTGCGSGIGYHCAHALARRGWRVFATCRRQADCERLAAEGLDTVRLDYSDPASIAAALDHVLAATGGRLDALFNNGGYSLPGALEDLSPDHVRAVIEANFIGWHDLTRRVIPVMRAQGSGRIVNCSSILGFVAVRFSGAYIAAKFAIEGWSDTLRLELHGSGIRVSVIEPGPIASNMLADARDRFLAAIDTDNSPFRDDYAKEFARLSSGSRSSLFQRSPQAVFTRLVHALESPRPRARYRVTIPTKFMALMKRLLPTAALDRILVRER